MNARRRDQQSGAERSSPGRPRQRGRSGSAKGPRTGQSQGQGQGQGQGRRGNPQRRRKRGNKPNPQQDPVAFWGDPSKLPVSQPDVRITDDASAVPRSLGAPPLPGHEAIAEHYFRVVFERAVTTAGALAAAGGLIDPDALIEELED